jgi:hypothetical protein
MNISRNYRHTSGSDVKRESAARNILGLLRAIISKGLDSIGIRVLTQKLELGRSY